MDTQITTQAQAMPAQQQNCKQIFALASVQNRFAELFSGDKSRAMAFITNVLSVVNNNALLAKAEPKTVLSAALLAAAVDLPVNPALGMAAIVPFYNGKSGRTEAQFQVMERGYIQLAQRTGRVARLTVNPVFEGEVEANRFTDDYSFHPATSGNIVGYLAYIRLTNGFEKFHYMTIAEIQQHAQRYSQTAKKGFGLWVDNFDAMAKKTVLKLLLMRWAPLATSDSLVKAGEADGAVLKIEKGQAGEMEFVPEYVDNEDGAAVEQPAEEASEPQKKAEKSGADAVKDAMKQSIKKA